MIRARMVEIVLLTLVVATHQGCTLIGLGTGVAIDALTPSVEAAPVWNVTSLHHDDHVIVVRSDGPPVDGRFVALDTLTDRERAECFPSFISAQGTMGCPTPGDSITIRKRTLTELEVRGSLERMTVDRIEVSTNNGRRSIRRNDVIQITDPRGLVWRGDQVSDYFLLNSVIVLRAHETARIPLMRVRYIEHRRAKYAILIGGGLGLALDIIWIRSARKAFSMH